MSRLWALAKKELQQLRRDRLTLAMMAIMPIVQLVLFGYAINTDVRHMAMVVFDQERSARSRELVAELVVTGYYEPVGLVESYDEIRRALRSDRARVALVIPPDFSEKTMQRDPVALQLVVDGSDPQTVGSATQTAASVVQARVEAGARQGPAINLLPTIWYNPDQRTAVYIVPGLVAVILTMTTVMLTAMGIARERERGTLEALIVSPAYRLEIVAGKITPYILIGYVQMTIIFVVGVLAFDVPMNGSWALLYAFASLFIAANLAVGLVFSTIAATQQQAMQMSFFFLLPNMLLSGFMFPYEGMPAPAQWLAEVLPLTHFLRIVRRIVLKGGELPDVANEALWLALILFVLVALTSVRFKKKLMA